MEPGKIRQDVQVGDGRVEFPVLGNDVLLHHKTVDNIPENLVGRMSEPPARFAWPRLGRLGAFDQILRFLVETCELLRVAPFGLRIVGRSPSRCFSAQPRVMGK